MIYYLETNALYHISKFSKDILDRSYTSIFAMLELVTGINEINFEKRRTVLSMVRDFKLTIDYALPEEIVFNSFDAFDEFEFIEKRTDKLQYLIDEILASENLSQYSSSVNYNAEFGAKYFRELDERISNTFIQASFSGVKEIKRTIEEAGDDCILEFEGNFHVLNTRKKMRDFLFSHRSVNNAVTINALVNMIYTAEVSAYFSIGEVFDSYNGLSNTFVETLSHFCTDSIIGEKTPAKNDFADMIHLLYLKSDPMRRIVSDDKIFQADLPSLTLSVSNLKTLSA